MNADFYVLLILFIYMPCHFLEEAMGNFPKWMYEHWTPNHLSYGQWMANNIFIFYPMLVISYLLFHFQPVTLRCFGEGILVWGIINFVDHFFYTIKDKKFSPGLVTGCIYLADSFLGIHALLDAEVHDVRLIVGMIVIGGFLFGLPCFLSMKLADRFEHHFGKRVE